MHLYITLKNISWQISKICNDKELFFKSRNSFHATRLSGKGKQSTLKVTISAPKTLRKFVKTA